MLVASVVRDLERALPAAEGGEPIERAASPITRGRLPLTRDRNGFRDPLIGRLGGLTRTRGEELRDVLAAIRAEKPVPGEITEAEVLAVAAAYAGPRLGEGLERLAAASVKLPRAGQVWVGEQGRAVELDAVLRALPVVDLPRFVERLAKVADAQDAVALETLIGEEG